LLSVKDPRNHTTSYVVDGFGQLWTQTSPDTGVTKFAYDATGLRTSMTRADLAATTFGYDDLGRLTTITAGGDPQTFVYDDCTSGLGHLCSVTDPTGSVSYTYTPEGQLLTQSSVLPASGLSSLAFSYDNMSRLAGITYPNGNSASYGYVYGKPATLTAKSVALLIP
jgi:YD repeat-containing protein